MDGVFGTLKKDLQKRRPHTFFYLFYSLDHFVGFLFSFSGVCALSDHKSVHRKDMSFLKDNSVSVITLYSKATQNDCKPIAKSYWRLIYGQLITYSLFNSCTVTNWPENWHHLPLEVLLYGSVWNECRNYFKIFLAFIYPWI